MQIMTVRLYAISSFLFEILIRRHKDEITRDLLSVCNGGATVTHVMFYGYITHRQARYYLGQLVQRGLMKSDSVGRRYYTTPEGMAFLNKLERMSELLPLLTRIPKQ